MPRFSANLTWLYTDRPLPDRFEAARRAGYQAVEIQFPYDTPLQQLIEAREASGLDVVLLNLPAGDLMQGGNGLACVPGKLPELLKGLEIALPYATALGTRVINVLAGRCPRDMGPAAAKATLARHLALLCDQLVNHDISISIEAINTYDMPGYLLDSSDALAAILAETGQPTLGMQLDLYHLARMGEDPAVVLDRHLAQTVHIQFADLPGRGAPGTGKLPFDKWFAQIDRLGYTGWCGAEYRHTAEDPAWLDAMTIHYR